MATKQVEARSLSDINILAANPPQYPHHPEVRESLTLYISRVPGTRDVILSTLRPQRKNVTAEDVANSLYYVHLDLPTDELLAAAHLREDPTSPRSSSESARSVIPRKPVPSSSRLPPKPENATPDGAAPITQPVAVRVPEPVTLDRGVPPVQSPIEMSRPNPMFRDQGPAPTPDAPELPPRPQSRPPPAASGLVARRPLGPRPQSTLVTPGAGDRPLTPTQPGPHLTEPARVGSPIRAINSHGGFSPSKPTARRASFYPFSLTLIRRDATTGGQWNIGKVTSFQTNIPTPDLADPSLNPDDMGALPRPHKIDIRLDTSGYAKYRGMPSLAAVEAFRPGSGHSFAQTMKGLGGSGGGTVPGPKGGHDSAEHRFARQVVMAYSKTWTSNIKHAFHRRDRATSSAGEGGDPFSPTEDLAPPKRPFQHQRAGSASAVGSLDLGQQRRDSGEAGRDSSPPSPITTPGPGLRPKGYVFVSPWDGRCEFRTSASGRSLKCQHILDPKSPRFNPVAVAQHLRDAQATGRRSRGDEVTAALVGAKPVSELRFNLPGTSDTLKTPPLLPKAAVEESGRGRWDHHHLQGKLQGGFRKVVQHLDKGSSDDEDLEDDEPMDLSIGREEMGGGTRGNRAKLGKLIIHDEGLKMLDLVVAANVGIWWTTWERTF
ncbi:hypothetical protein B0H67DRAFT_480518 [Lasiosphaeris hirsuta]|uniref:Oxidoreductase-like protein n=1 Tax=Lasiosphaeris hirsuta TaxID=260670 RepID=A0AA40AXZ0_9PEZI|nr:hypothetical protein B0H67DRAFT_480518 [Lasiosphaeris hirsuta]